MDFCEFHHTVAEIMQIKNMLYTNLKNIHRLFQMFYDTSSYAETYSHMKWEIVMTCYKILFELHLPQGTVENH